LPAPLVFAPEIARAVPSAPPRAGDRVVLCAGAGGPGAGNLEHICPTIQEWQEEVAALHVRGAQNPWFTAHVKERRGVECVGIRRGDSAEGRVWIMPKLDQLAHGGAGSLRGRHVGDEPPCHLHGYERVAVDVGVGGEPEVLEPFADAQVVTEFGSAGRVVRHAREQADATDEGLAS